MKRHFWLYDINTFFMASDISATAKSILVSFHILFYVLYVKEQPVNAVSCYYEKAYFLHNINMSLIAKKA